MTIESVIQESDSQKAAQNYDPFLRGPHPVGVRTIQTRDTVRNRPFPCEIWYPGAAQHAGHDLSPESQDTFQVPLLNAQWRQMAVRDAAPLSGTYPLIIFSHHSGGHRRSATFLCTHLSSHGYVVAALDHSEVVAPELARKEGETAEQKASRWEAVIASRVPDARFLIDFLSDRLSAQRYGSGFGSHSGCHPARDRGTQLWSLDRARHP
jgi:predicted dienelactone hydrolase